MRKNRNEVQIIFEFMVEIQDGNTQTSSLLRKVNIPFNKYQELIQQLKDRGMLSVTPDGNKVTLELTDRGKEFLEQYKKFSKMMEKSYGLTL
ncbi:MAG: winged helix-turn-helix domain-containing protein [Thermoplasmatales archaeon]